MVNRFGSRGNEAETDYYFFVIFLQNFSEKKNFETKKIRKRSLCHRVSLVKVVRGIYMMICEVQIQNLTSGQGQVNP